MVELLTILVAVFVAHWYLGGATLEKPRRQQPNVNRDVDEWNARELVEEESESFYE